MREKIEEYIYLDPQEMVYPFVQTMCPIDPSPESRLSQRTQAS